MIVKKKKMIVKQIPQDEALRLFLKGTDIMIMTPGTRDSGWSEMTPDTLSCLLEGVMFFRREPAMETGLDIKTDRTLSDIPSFNPSQGPDNTGIDSDNEAEKEADNSDDQEPEASEYDNEKDAKHKKRVQVDTGKLMALRKAGWTVPMIADELGIGKSTVYNYVMKMQKGAANEND